MFLRVTSCPLWLTSLLNHKGHEVTRRRNNPVQTYWTDAFSILLATLTPPNPFTYREMPRYNDSAIRCLYSGPRSRFSSPGLLMNEISARIDGMFAPIRTTNG